MQGAFAATMGQAHLARTSVPVADTGVASMTRMFVFAGGMMLGIACAIVAPNRIDQMRVGVGALPGFGWLELIKLRGELRLVLMSTMKRLR